MSIDQLEFTKYCIQKKILNPCFISLFYNVEGLCAKIALKLPELKTELAEVIDVEKIFRLKSAGKYGKKKDSDK